MQPSDSSEGCFYFYSYICMYLIVNHMKKLFILVLCMMFAHALFAQEITTKENSSIPQGVMTYNPWSGKISVGGVTIENELLNNYLSQEDIKTYKGSRTCMLVGGIVGIVGAVPFGWSIGTAIAGAKPNLGMLIGGGVAFVGGIVVSLVGEGKVKSIVNKYNSTFSFQPQFQFGATDNGVGLALVF